MKKKRDGTRKHFREGGDAAAGHPVYIYDRVAKKYKFIGLTHSDITHGVKNIELDTNPNPQDPRRSYIRPAPRVDKTSKFGEKLLGWRFGKSDKDKIEKVIKKDKGKRK